MMKNIASENVGDSPTFTLPYAVHLVVRPGELSPLLMAGLHRANFGHAAARETADGLRIDGTRILIPWSVARALLRFRDLRPTAFVAQLRTRAKVLVSDEGLILLSPAHTESKASSPVA